MRASLKLKWLTALLSGQYKQGQSQLRYEAEPGDAWGTVPEPERYCCLGVLCDISGKGRWQGASFVYRRKRRSGFVPKPLREELGLSAEQENVLAQMNDGGDGFAKIAQWIAANVV